MKTIYLLTLSALTFIVSACADAQNYRTSKPPLVETKEKNIDKITNELQKEHLLGTFDGLITISKGNSILFKHAYGFADRKDRRKIPLKPLLILDPLPRHLLLLLFCNLQLKTN